MAYALSNMCAKNFCKRTVIVQLIIKNVVTWFFGTQWMSVYMQELAVFQQSKIVDNIFTSDRRHKKTYSR